MSGYPQGQGQGGQGHHDYDDGYGHGHQGNTDSYYQDDQQYYDNNGHNNQGGHQQGDGYYDESYVAAMLPVPLQDSHYVLLTSSQRLLQCGPQQPLSPGWRVLRQS